MLEVIIAFLIAIMSVSTILWILSNLSGPRYDKKEILKHIEKINKIIIAEIDNRAGIIDSYPSRNFKNINISMCYIKQYKDILYEACNVKTDLSQKVRYNFYIIRVNNFYFLFSKNGK